MKIKEYNSKYFDFWLTTWYNFTFVYEVCGYYSSKPRIKVSFLGLFFVFKFPFDSGLYEESEPKRYGVAYHNKTFWVYWGLYMRGYSAPHHLKLHKRSTLTVDGWVDNYKGDLYDDPEGKLSIDIRNLIYKLDSGKIKNIRLRISFTKCEFRLNWFMWLPLTKKVVKSLNYSSDEEFIEGTGNWKGGVMSGSMAMKPNETAFETIERLKKQKFKKYEL